jgi:tRNA G18 (ribose-2'-O)-methylase SpoU
VAHLVPLDRIDPPIEANVGTGLETEIGTHLETPLEALVSDYRDLTDVALRRRLETEQGLFLAEGSKVIQRAVAAGYRPRSALASARWAGEVAELLHGHDVPVFVLPEGELARLTGYHVHRGALASMNRRPLPTVEEVLTGARRVMVLEGVVEPTNVGAVFRAAAALGTGAVLLDPTCADPLYRRALKVSMGAVLTLPWTRLAPWPAALESVRAAGFEVWALTPGADAQDLDRCALEPPDRLALLLGTEGDGLATRTMARADRRVRIPMAAGVDSLNVGSAAAVACWAVRPR